MQLFNLKVHLFQYEHAAVRVKGRPTLRGRNGPLPSVHATSDWGQTGKLYTRSCQKGGKSPSKGCA